MFIFKNCVQLTFVHSFTLPCGLTSFASLRVIATRSDLALSSFLCPLSTLAQWQFTSDYFFKVSFLEGIKSFIHYIHRSPLSAQN